MLLYMCVLCSPLGFSLSYILLEHLHIFEGECFLQALILLHSNMILSLYNL